MPLDEPPSDQPPEPPAELAQESAQAFRWLPVSRTKRVLLGLAAAAFVGFVFNAYLHPDMVFDLANMVFCG